MTHYIHKPYFIFRPNALETASHYFQANLNGHILYAVKANPDQKVIEALYRSGIKKFDVASLEEVRKIHCWLPEAEIYFMHPIKCRFAIKEAYYKYGVRHFSLDSNEELDKILSETDQAKDLNLHLRLSAPNAYSEINLSNKFGINQQEAPTLLKKMRQHANKVGVCFHVGSQCMHPEAYRVAIHIAGKVMDHAEIKVDYFNVGGGFPSAYPGMIPPPLDDYFDIIHHEFSLLNKNQSMTLISEPGRALVAESMSLVVKVDLRRENDLYINDGTYGSLFDAGTPRFIFPVRLLHCQNRVTEDPEPFRFYGPTCDGLDVMPGPFYLPNNVGEGDYIEIGQLGAYGRTLATKFNGFSHEKEVVISNDEPMMTMYGNDEPMEVAV